MTTDSTQDEWARWLLERRHGGDAAQLEALLPRLQHTRDRVLEKASIAEGDVLLDVGAGDGLIAFGALSLIGTQGRIIFTDISQDLLDHSRRLATQLRALDRIDFVRAPANELSMIPNGSVDAVTTRSVLIYVDRKREAFHEFYRVLRSGGRISSWEPINSFASPEPDDRFMGVDVTAIRALAGKVRALYERLQPADTDPMLNFDERDLLHLAEEAGFREIHLALEADVEPAKPTSWEVVWKSSGNPKIPTLEEAVAQVLTPAEAERFVEHMRPPVEAGERVHRMAIAHLWAVKS